jgi:hypothetical protein
MRLRGEGLGGNKHTLLMFSMGNNKGSYHVGDAGINIRPVLK